MWLNLEKKIPFVLTLVNKKILKGTLHKILNLAYMSLRSEAGNTCKEPKDNFFLNFLNEI
jgi:hypothetical protein